MLFFGFTHCPDVCPFTLARMAQAVRELGEDGARGGRLRLLLSADSPIEALVHDLKVLL